MWMREGGILQHVFLSLLSTLVRGKTGGLPRGSRRDQYYTRVELDLKWSARLPWRRQGPTWNPLNIYFLSTELTNNWMKWEGKEQLSFLFLISAFFFFFFTLSSSRPSLLAVALGAPTLSICFAFKGVTWAEMKCTISRYPEEMGHAHTHTDTHKHTCKGGGACMCKDCDRTHTVLQRIL